MACKRENQSKCRIVSTRINPPHSEGRPDAVVLNGCRPVFIFGTGVAVVKVKNIPEVDCEQADFD